MAENKALTGATVFTGDEIITGKTLLIKDGIITGLVNNELVPEGSDLTDCKGMVISPGFIDLQIAGAGGYLFSSDPTPKALKVITESIVSTGTTGFLIVLPTNSPEVYSEAIKTIKSNPSPAVLGLHLEGPYISQQKRGAHVAEFIREPDLEQLEKLLSEGEGVIKMVTVAPEVCFPEFISMLNDRGIIVCAGHSNATFSEASEGFSQGIRATTHLFNAMSAFHHRDPGLPGATFQTENIMASIVADGIHVDYNTISIAKKLMKERLYLISDAVEENRSGAYRHQREGERFTLPDGTLSGSALTMMKAVKNCVENVGIPLDEALRMASLYPARLINLTDRGRIAPGLKADLVVFDNFFDVKHVFRNGIGFRKQK
jgi:N-acetylglucosamine-6-phosphate deacetylase